MKNFEYAKKEKTFRKFPFIILGESRVHILLLPIALFILTFDKIQDWNYNRLEWSEEKAKKALDYFLPYVLEYDENENAYFYCMNWTYGGREMSKKVPFGMKEWTKKYGRQILNYLKEDYEKVEYFKSIEADYYDTWIRFQKKT